MKKIAKKILVLFLFLLLVISSSFMAIGGGSITTPNSDAQKKLNATVEAYRETVQQIADDEGIVEYVDLIMCVMQIESGGTGLDPMQSSEGPFNKNYPQVPNGITDPKYSIICGIKELKDCLIRAEVRDTADYENIKIALGGYNFGNGFIEWIQKNHNGTWSLRAAQEFSNIWKKKLGWKVYGDPPYAQKVMKYYTGKGVADDIAKTSAMGKENYKALIKEAEKYIGFPYVFGGSNPSSSFDCSGYISWVFIHSNVYNLKRTTAQVMYEQCAKIDKKEAKPGDLIFFTNTYDCPDPVSHIGIYIGNNQMLHCGDPIGYTDISDQYWQYHFYGFGRLPIEGKGTK